MPDLSAELNLALALGGDDTRDYLAGSATSLRSSLLVIDGLFNTASGHTHGGAHQGGAISSIPATAIPDGAITNPKLAANAVTELKIADGAVTGPKLATPLTISGDFNARYLTTSDGSNGIVSARAGSLYLRSSGGTNGVIVDGASGGLTVNGGPVNVTGGGLTASGDVIAGGLLRLSPTGPYWQNAGGIMATNSLISTNNDFVAQGNITVDSGNGNAGTVGRTLRLGNNSGECIGSRRDGAAGSYGIDFYTSSTRRGGFNSNGLFDVGGLRAVVNNAPNGIEWKLDAGETFMSPIPNGGFLAVNIGYNGAYASPPCVVATINGTAGGDNTQGLLLSVRAISTSGFIAVVRNDSGHTESIVVNWMAFGH